MALTVALLGGVVVSTDAQVLDADAVAADRLPDGSRNAGWHFGIGVGTLSWGRSSVCRCAPPSLDVSVGLETELGWGLEYKPTLTATTEDLIDHALNAYYYPRLGRHGRAVGLYAGGGVLSVTRSRWTSSRGYSTSVGVRARAPLGKRERTRVFLDLGLASFRQRLASEEEWRIVNVTREQVHRGLRIRVGVVW